MPNTQQDQTTQPQQQFKLGEFVETKKGAKFWGQIIAFDNDMASPGCTVLAIAPGFEGTKHVYPLAQIKRRTFMNTEIPYNEPEGIVAMGVGNGNGSLFIYGSHDSIHRVRAWLYIVEAAFKYVKAWKDSSTATQIAAARNTLCDQVEQYDKTA